MKIIMLPAFDGTGEMFREFSAALGEGFEPVPVSYPGSGPQDYDTLADYVRGLLPKDEDFVILGESFAGPIVYRIAARAPACCRAAVFVATYLTNPRPRILKVMTALPAPVISFFISRPWVVRLVSLTRSAEPRVAKAIAANFASVTPAVIKQRLKTIGNENNEPQDDVPVPSLYIQADSDRLVLPKKIPDFHRRCASLDIAVVRGGHFVLQENPEGGAGVVRAYLEHSISREDAKARSEE